MARERALVTGATGFIGRVLIDRLREASVAVRGVARRRAASTADELVETDLAELTPQSTLLDDVDVVYHLAAKTHDLADARGVEAEYDRVNVEGTRRLLALLPGRRVRRIVFVSSVKAVGEGGDAEIDERTPARPTTAYGRSKRAAEELVAEMATANGVEAVSLRFPMVYGPGQRGNLQRMVRAIDRGRFPPPPANRNRRSMLHVENAAQALMLGGTHPAARGRTYFVTDTRPYSTRELYDSISSALGRRPTRWEVPEAVFRAAAKAGDAARALVGRRVGFDSDAAEKLLGSAWYSSALIARELGYAPAWDLESALPAIVAEVRARGSS